MINFLHFSWIYLALWSHTKTYDDCVLIKTADIGQMIKVKEEGDSSPAEVESGHGLTPPMRDAQRRRFCREPDLNPEFVQCIEKDLQNIMAGGTAENIDVEAGEQEDDGEGNARNACKKTEPKTPEKPDVPEAGTAESAFMKSCMDTNLKKYHLVKLISDQADIEQSFLHSVVKQIAELLYCIQPLHIVQRQNCFIYKS